MLDDDAPEGDVRALAARVNYDGSLTILLDVPGEQDPVEHTIPGDRHTVLMTYHGQSKDVDLAGTKADDRRCQEIVARGVRRLNEDRERRRAADARRRREHEEREDERYGDGFSA